jgi:hypothetical protein
MTATCPESRRSAQPQGLDRLVMVVGLALESWALSHADRKALGHADQKAMVRTRSPLSALSDYEQVSLYREATQLREQAYADRARWHVTG